MSAAGSYPRSNVKTRRAAPADESQSTDRPAVHDPFAVGSAGSSRDGNDGREDRTVPAGMLAERVDLAGLSIAGITRRRVGWVAAALLAVWIVIVFARQVGDASAAASRSAQLAADNAALAAEVQSLQADANLIVQPEYVAIAARGQGFGGSHEIAFTLAPSVAAPVDGAPGSASVRLGATTDHQTPLDSWLSLLFGPGG
jgi:cell division protein FtsB